MLGFKVLIFVNLCIKLIHVFVNSKDAVIYRYYTLFHYMSADTCFVELQQIGQVKHFGQYASLLHNDSANLIFLVLNHHYKFSLLFISLLYFYGTAFYFIILNMKQSAMTGKSWGQRKEESPDSRVGLKPLDY